MADTVTEWPVRAFASWTVAPLAMRDDEPAMEAFLAHRVEQLREEATCAGHRLLPQHDPVVQVTEVYVPTPEEIEAGDDTVMVGWFGEGPTYRHNALRILTEIRVGYNPAVAAAELEEILATREPDEEEYGEKVWIIALLCSISIGLYGITLTLAAMGDALGTFVCLIPSVAALTAAFYLDRRARNRKEPR